LARDTRAGARRSLDIAERLDPRVGEQWLGRAMLVEDARAIELSEKYLRQGLAVEPNSSHLNGFLSAYLANTGNGREAEVYALRAVELDPAKLALTSNAARIMVQNGKLREALDLLNAAELRHPHEPDFVWTRIRLLMFGGAPAQARALLDNEAELPGWMDAAKVVELRRIASAIENPESPDAKALARELIARKTDDPASTIVPLAAIGRSDAAIDMGMTEAVDVGLFFFPGAESALRHPRFPEVARYHGLWAYWKATGRWPDICRDPTLPWQCEKTGKPAS
jgi:Tfp pilus assembly protein PilF